MGVADSCTNSPDDGAEGFWDEFAGPGLIETDEPRSVDVSSFIGWALSDKTPVLWIELGNITNELLCATDG